MAQSHASEGRSGSDSTKTTARPAGLMARIYRDIGLAAVAGALEISTADFDPELGESIKRGARYLFLRPQSSAVA
jgi:hypothetical protein